jgi:adenylate cyclase class 2
MQYEVEQKHLVVDAAALKAQLAARGVALQPPVLQSDKYFAHPARDFAKTVEAFRIRTTGGKSFITYKGRSWTPRRKRGVSSSFRCTRTTPME